MISIGRIVDRLTRKDWTVQELSAILGSDASAAWTTHAADSEIRAEATSGGTVSALVIHGIERGLFDGAILCTTSIEDGKVRAKFVLARTKEDVLSCRGSKYVETRFLREVLPILRSTPGRFAVCGLPCDISNLRRWEERDPELADRVALRIALFCGHNSRKELIDGITLRLSREASPARLVDFHFRRGHWRGALLATYSNGVSISKPATYFTDYRNLGCFSEKKCIACFDHFGYDSDLSIGDVWLYSLRHDSIKHSGVLVRTDRAAQLMSSAIEGQVIAATSVPIRMMLDGQSRSAPSHYNITARSQAGRRLGIYVPDPIGLKTTWVQRLSAYVGLLNMRLSEQPNSAWIFSIPRPLIRLYLYFKKGLESVR